MRSVILQAPHLKRDVWDLVCATGATVQTGEQTPRGEDGCLAAHKQAILWALARGDQQLFVMEDDCGFTPHFDWIRWQTDAYWAQAHGYDVMAGGCTRTYDQKVVREDPQGAMVEVSGFHSAHCVVYFASGYEKALRAVQPYDWSLGRDCGMRCVLTWPFVAVQRASYSGILKERVNYEPLYASHEQDLGYTLGIYNRIQRGVNV